jgi:hypothetical protein
MKIGYWVEYNHNMDKGSIIARVSIRKIPDMYEVEILDILYTSGRYTSGQWDIGAKTAILEHDLPGHRETIQFIFEKMT